MPEYRIEFVKIPTNYNETRLMFIEAESPEEANSKARNAVERSTCTPARDFVWGKPEAI